MFGKTTLVLLILLVIAGTVSARESSTCIFNADNSLNFNLINHQSYFNTQSNITLYADGGRKPWGGSPIVAGITNTFFGIWSWTNMDWLGGAVTTGLYATGLVLLIIDNNRGFIGYTAGSIAVISLLAAPVFGFIRGFFHYEKMYDASLASAFNDNPLKHISLVVLPTFNQKRVKGALTYSLSFF
jgi:hypothetical protein